MEGREGAGGGGTGREREGGRARNRRVRGRISGTLTRGFLQAGRFPCTFLVLTSSGPHRGFLKFPVLPPAKPER